MRWICVASGPSESSDDRLPISRHALTSRSSKTNVLDLTESINSE